MSFSGNYGSSSNSSSSKPLSPAEMQGYYDVATSNVNKYVPQGQTYKAPQYATPTAVQF